MTGNAQALRQKAQRLSEALSEAGSSLDKCRGTASYTKERHKYNELDQAATDAWRAYDRACGPVLPAPIGRKL